MLLSANTKKEENCYMSFFFFKGKGLIRGRVEVAKYGEECEQSGQPLENKRQ